VTRTSKHISGLFVLAATAWIGIAPLASAQDDLTVRNFGTEVVNIATLTQTVNGNQQTVPTNAAVFVIRPPQTPAIIEFFRHAPTSADPIFRAINGTDFSPSGSLDGPFSSIGPSVTAGGGIIDLSSPIPLIPASTYLAGELMFVRVIDAGQNLDSSEIETVVITVTVISADGNTQLTATYIDILDQTDVVVDTAILNPLNSVFSSVDGERIDDAVVTLINVDTGARATVYGVDGFSTFPGQVVSGSDTTDGAGLVYNNDDGEFRFPIVEPGTYRIEVEPPEGYNFSTVLGINEFASLKLSDGFEVTSASLGEIFTVTETGPLRFDVPLDPESELIVTKSASIHCRLGFVMCRERRVLKPRPRKIL